MRKAAVSLLLCLSLLAGPAAALPEQPAANTLYALFSEMLQEKGTFRGWSLEDKARFSSELPALCSQELARPGGSIPAAIDEILLHTHGLPSEGDMAEEAALGRAVTLLRQLGKLSAEALEAYVIFPFFYADKPSDPVWSFWFYRDEKHYEVEVNARTGYVVLRYDIHVPGEQTAKEIATSYRLALEAAHGPSRYWSLEEKATLSRLYKEAGMKMNSVDGLPGEGDLSKTAAVQLAKQDAQSHFGVLPEAMAEFGIALSFDVTNPSQPIWRVEFYWSDDPLGSYLIALDARTGEVLHRLGPGEGNG